MRVGRETINSVIAAGASKQEIAVGLGIAGFSEDKEAERVAAALPDFARIVVVNDAVAACVGANGLGDGGLVIAGTGSAGIPRLGAPPTLLGRPRFPLPRHRPAPPPRPNGPPPTPRPPP